MAPAAVARHVVTAAAAVVVFGFAWLYRFNDPSGSFAGLTDDHFFYLVRGWQILFGDLPVRDFVDHGAPLFYYAGAAVQVLFGRGTLSELVFCVTVLAVCASAVCLLGARASGLLLLGVAAAAVHIWLAPRFYNYPKILVYVAAVPALWTFVDRPGRWSMAAIAAVTAVGFLFRHDHAVFVGGAFAALLLLRAWSWRERVRHAATYGVLVLLLLSPYLLFIQANGGLVSYFRTAAAWAERDRDRAPAVWPGLFDNPDGVSVDATAGAVPQAVDTIQDNAVAWLFYAELALPLLALLLLAVSPSAFRPGWPNARVKVAVVAVLGVLLNLGFLRGPLEARLADPSVPHVLLLAWLPVALVGLFRRGLVEERFRAGRAWPALRGIATVAIGLLLAIVVIATTARLPVRLEAAVVNNGVEAALERAGRIRDQIDASWPLSRANTPDDPGVLELAFYLAECTRPSDRVLMQHYLPQVLALAQRGFAGGHADLRPGFFASDDMQRLTVARLQRQPVPVVLLAAGADLESFRGSFPLVVAYLDAQYVNAGERALDERYSVNLLVSRAAAPRGRYEPLDWPCVR